jgi:hypothetical protein
LHSGNNEVDQLVLTIVSLPQYLIVDHLFSVDLMITDSIPGTNSEIVFVLDGDVYGVTILRDDCSLGSVSFRLMLILFHRMLRLEIMNFHFIRWMDWAVFSTTLSLSVALGMPTATPSAPGHSLSVTQGSRLSDAPVRFPDSLSDSLSNCFVLAGAWLQL